MIDIHREREVQSVYKDRRDLLVIREDQAKKEGEVQRDREETW